MVDWFAKNAQSTATKDSATLLANVQTVNKTAQTMIKSALLPLAVSKYALLQTKVQDAINAVNLVQSTASLFAAELSKTFNDSVRKCTRDITEFQVMVQVRANFLSKYTN